MSVTQRRSAILILIAAFAASYGLPKKSGAPVQSRALRRTLNNHDLSAYAAGYEGIVFTQVPQARAKDLKPLAGGLLPAQFGDGAHLALLSKTGDVHILTPDFDSAADPAVSFDGKRILFAGKKSAADNWNIYEMNADGSGVRQITRDMGNCRSPMYQSALFYLNDSEPSYQVTFVSDASGEANEYGPLPASNLYSVRFDGSGLRRLTYAVSSSYAPYQMQDGRIVFSNWQRSHMERGIQGRIDLFGINLDGTDYAAFSGIQGRRIKHMACTTPKRMVVFVESDRVPWDGSGNLAILSLRRNLHSYKALTTPSDGLFHSPSALPDGSILVSRRSVGGNDTHAIYRLDLNTGRRTLVYADPAFHNIQSVVLAPRPEPDGHSSVVEDDQNWSKLYCLTVHENDLNPEARAEALRFTCKPCSTRIPLPTTLCRRDWVWPATKYRAKHRHRFSLLLVSLAGSQRSSSWRDEPDTYAAHAYDGMNMLIWAIQVAGLNRAKIRDVLAYRFKPWPGVTGDIPFGAALDDIGDVFLAKFENGGWRFYSREDLNVPRGYIPARDRVNRATGAIDPMKPPAPPE